MAGSIQPAREAGKAQNKFQDPAKRRRLIVDLIDPENWSSMSADVKGGAYEGLLEKNAQDTKSGAGQYFTWPTPTTSRRRTSSPRKSCRTWRRRWSSFG